MYDELILENQRKMRLNLASNLKHECCTYNYILNNKITLHENLVLHFHSNNFIQEERHLSHKNVNQQKGNESYEQVRGNHQIHFL